MPEGHVTALLGPTNTGKTTRAIDIALTYPTAMFGFPLRLLARENYLKIVELKGIDHVSLVTGEEKTGPADASYSVATVESMPVSRVFDCVVVDEVQLAADPSRGHVFTNRLMRARGRKSTLFLGAPGIAPLLRRLIPDISITYCQRLSPLTHRPGLRLSRLPRRSAVVAFSVAHCYALAAELRTLYGGTAVVLGALSPRTRNAQVALFQSGEVDYVVATDAIGLGLNLPINHVAFANRSKFDGYERRQLTLSEIGQIAGRAGRGLREGSFGAIDPLPDFSARDASRVIEQNFAPIERFYWRNPDIDFYSTSSLINSLQRRPRQAFLAHPRTQEDMACLLTLCGLDKRYLKLEGSDLKQLWDFCRIPNFRKQTPDQHAHTIDVLWKLYRRNDGNIPSSWLNQRLKAMQKLHPHIEGLLDGIARIRELNYLTQNVIWVNEQKWRDETRKLEETWSDCLHRALSERFVEGTRRGRATLTRQDARIRGLWISGDAVASLREAQRLRRKLLPHVVAKAKDWKARLENGDRSVWQLQWPDRLLLGGEDVARIDAGDHPLRPRLEWHPHHLPEDVASYILPAIEQYVRKGIADQFERLLVDPVIEKQENAAAGSGMNHSKRYDRILRYHMGTGLGMVDVNGLRRFVPGLPRAHAPFVKAFPKDWCLCGGYLWDRQCLDFMILELRAVLLHAFYPAHRPIIAWFREQGRKHGVADQPPLVDLEMSEDLVNGKRLDPDPIVLMGYTRAGLSFSLWSTLLSALESWAIGESGRSRRKRAGSRHQISGKKKDLYVPAPPAAKWPTSLIPLVSKAGLSTQQRRRLLEEVSSRCGYCLLLPEATASPQSSRKNESGRGGGRGKRAVPKHALKRRQSRSRRD